MTHFEYFLLLAGCLLSASAGGFYFKVMNSVFLRVKDLCITLALIFVIFVTWDFIAIQRGHWFFNSQYITNVRVLQIPIEELTFFIVIPFLCIVVWEILNSLIPKE